MLVLLVVSGVGLIVFILLHSGKGTGISDMIASSVYSTQTGTSIVEKNLDRITIIFAVVFLLSLIVLMIIYPAGNDRDNSRKFALSQAAQVRVEYPTLLVSNAYVGVVERQTR